MKGSDGAGLDDHLGERVKMPRKTRNLPRRSPKRKVVKHSFKVTCAGCGKELVVEVSPPDKPLLCLDCYNK